MYKRTRHTAALLAPLVTASLATMGCGSTWLASDDRPTPGVSPDDFIGDSQADASNSDDPTTPVSVPIDDALSDGPPTQVAAPATIDQALPMDAMIGHINGEAIYADQIFDVNLVAQLQSFGGRFEREAFSNAAGSAIQDKLQGIIINKLILGEAERNLQEAQRRGIGYRIQSEREELLRFYGQGSLAKAKAEFKKERGKELEQHLVDFREELIIRSYIQSKVSPKIVVNQRDVERYYADHIDQYQQPDARVIRLIIATDAKAGAQIKMQLDKGVAFKKLAANQELNRYNPTQAGMYQGGVAIAGNTMINQKPVNDALLPLEVGEHAGPIVSGKDTFFVEIVERTEGVKLTLADVQINIESILRSKQFEKHALRFRIDLLKRGSYSDPAEMGQKLLDIAFARYDR